MNALVSIRDGEVRASSQDVAAAFEKAHKDVLRAIDRMIELAPELTGRNFALSQMQSPGTRGRMVRGYDMDRDGFSLLAMGFTGAKALEWKLKFLDAFRRMEQALSQSLAVNDNGMEALHPLLRSGEGREAFGRGMEAARRMKELRGEDAALALWKKLGLPLPDDIDSYSLPALRRALLAPSDARKGEMHEWVKVCRVRPAEDHSARVHRRLLFECYVNWCGANGLIPYGAGKFAWHLRNHFGPGQYEGDTFFLRYQRKAEAFEPGEQDG